MGGSSWQIGKGVEEFDHEAVGTPYWPLSERAARFREYVEVVDGLLRSSQVPFTFEGRYYSTHHTSSARPSAAPVPSSHCT
jgi:alkanesulfonate monooxygenase SsuD/methylene tetrahydromethanopterin reductase-like flavin-dependent oxidoreductase (luciferase family)